MSDTIQEQPHRGSESGTQTDTVEPSASTAETRTPEQEDHAAAEGVVDDIMLRSSMSQLFEMGFWNKDLNKRLLKSNKYDVSTTIEELLRPETRQGTPPQEPVVSSQPRQQQRPNTFIYEFD